MEPEQINPFTVIAAVAGSITGLTFMTLEAMTRYKIALTIFAGFSCALFVAPWLAHLVFGVKATSQQIAMTTYGTGAGAHIILPRVIEWLTRAFGGKA